MLIIDSYPAKGHTEVETKLEKIWPCPACSTLDARTPRWKLGAAGLATALFGIIRCQLVFLEEGAAEPQGDTIVPHPRHQFPKAPTPAGIPSSLPVPHCSIPLLCFSNNEQIPKLYPGTALVTLKIQL